MGIQPFVIHDEDRGNERAEIFNAPILEAVGDNSKRIMLSNCIEDVLGYAPPSNEKPYKAYNFIAQNWNLEWDSVTPRWKEIVTLVFKESFDLILREIRTAEDLAAAATDQAQR